MTRTIRHFFPDLTVYPALGNHDYWPQVTCVWTVQSQMEHQVMKM